MAREFSAYFETFVTQRKDGKAWDFLVRVYSYAPQPGFIQNLTGNAPSEEKAKAAGCDDYLSKPINEDLLYAKLRTFLGDRCKE